MSASNDELLFYAAWDGDVAKVKDLLSEGTGTGYRFKVSQLFYKVIFRNIDDDDNDADDDNKNKLNNDSEDVVAVMMQRR